MTVLTPSPQTGIADTDQLWRPRTPLERVLDFYALRDLRPERWYPRARDGHIAKFDDLPPAYASNVNVEPPFDRKRGDRPALSTAERADIVAFLKTLTDRDLVEQGNASPAIDAGLQANAARR